MFIPFSGLASLIYCFKLLKTFCFTALFQMKQQNRYFKKQIYSLIWQLSGPLHKARYLLQSRSIFTFWDDHSWQKSEWTIWNLLLQQIHVWQTKAWSKPTNSSPRLVIEERILLHFGEIIFLTLVASSFVRCVLANLHSTSCIRVLHSINDMEKILLTACFHRKWSLIKRI